MRSVKLCIAYDGTEFAGWQRQKGDRTVQQVLEEATESVVGHRVPIVGAGRTDRGAHARGQVAAFRTESAIPDEGLPFAINARLPASVRVTSAETVPADFHPSLSAIGKHYRYTIWCGKIAPAIGRDFMAPCPYDLDWDAIVTAAAPMVGRQDFRAFKTWAKGQEAVDTVRDVGQLVLRRTEELLLVDVLGSGFLYKQVRTMVGTLIDVGRGRIPPSRVGEILSSRDRRLAGPTVPGKGLCLMQVFYDPVPDTWHECPGPVWWPGAERCAVVGGGLR